MHHIARTLPKKCPFSGYGPNSSSPKFKEAILMAALNKSIKSGYKNKEGVLQGSNCYVRPTQVVCINSSKKGLILRLLLR